MDPTCCDEYVEKIGNCVRGLEVEYVFVKDKGDRGVKEESDGELRAVLLDGWGCGEKAPDGHFEVLDITKAGVVEKLNWNSVDCDECW